jgi:hypothetical protein
LAVKKLFLIGNSKVSIKVVIIPCDGGKKSGGRKRARIVKKVVGEGGGIYRNGKDRAKVCLFLQKRIVHELKRHQSYSWYDMCPMEPI